MSLGLLIAWFVIFKLIVYLFGSGSSGGSSSCGRPYDASQDCSCGHVHDGGRGCDSHGCHH